MFLLPSCAIKKIYNPFKNFLMGEKQKILVISDTFYPRRGGTEIIFLEVLKRLRRKFEIHVLASFYGIEREENPQGMKIKRIKVRNRVLFTFLSLFKAVKHARQASIIQTCACFSAFSAFFLAKLFRKPCVLLVNGYFGKKWLKLRKFPLSLIYLFFESILFSLPFAHFIVLSNAQKQKLVKFGIPESRITVAHPGINAKLFRAVKVSRKNLLGVSKKTFVFCFFGRYDKQKGIELLLSAAKMFFKRKRNAKLLLITEKDRVLPQIKKLKLEKFVILKDLMPQKELVRYLSASDVIVIPSVAEPFGMVAAESLALNKVVITTGVDGLGEIVRNHGIIAKTPEEIASALEKCCELKENGRLKVNARSYVVKKFSWNKMAEKFERVYGKILKS